MQWPVCVTVPPSCDSDSLGFNDGYLAPCRVRTRGGTNTGISQLKENRMGATVVDSSVNASNWNKQKPDGFDSKDLDKAIKAYEALVSKAPSVPASLPTMPAQNVKEYEA